MKAELEMAGQSSLWCSGAIVVVLEKLNQHFAFLKQLKDSVRRLQKTWDVFPAVQAPPSCSHSGEYPLPVWHNANAGTTDLEGWQSDCQNVLCRKNAFELFAHYWVTCHKRRGLHFKFQVYAGVEAQTKNSGRVWHLFFTLLCPVRATSAHFSS